MTFIISTKEGVNMKKALSLLLFVLIAIGISMPLYAGELNVINSFTVKMFNGDRGDFCTDDDTEEGMGTQNSVSQLLESKGSYSTEPGFSINWWLEAGGGTWGYTTGSEDYELDWKALYAKWETERFGITAGYLEPYMGNGYNFQIDGIGGFIVDLKPAKGTTITLLASLRDENNDYSSDNDDDENTNGEEVSDDDGYEDTWTYGAQITKDINSGNVSLYYLINDNEVDDDQLNTIGVSGNYKVNSVSLSGEAATFFGDASDGSDYTGFFITAGAEIPLNDVLSTEVNLYFAPGNSDDDETAKYSFDKRGMQQPLNKGLGTILDHDDSNLQLFTKGGTNICDLSSNEAGVIAAVLSGSYKTSQATSLNAGIIFAMPELDGDDAGWDNLMKLNASIIHAVSKSLTVGLGASYMTADSDSTWEDDAYGSTVFMAWSF
jgi:hypothetical protein